MTKMDSDRNKETGRFSLYYLLKKHTDKNRINVTTFALVPQLILIQMQKAIKAQISFQYVSFVFLDYVIFAVDITKSSNTIE